MKSSKTLPVSDVLEALKHSIATISSDSSGALIESAIQILPDDEFFSLIVFLDEAPVGPSFEWLCEVILFIAKKINFGSITEDQCSMGVANVWSLCYRESLRRKGLILYTQHSNIFEEDLGEMIPTEEGKKYIETHQLESLI